LSMQVAVASVGAVIATTCRQFGTNNNHGITAIQ
jgi:hypothetical protein